MRFLVLGVEDERFDDLVTTARPAMDLVQRLGGIIRIPPEGSLSLPTSTAGTRSILDEEDAE